MITNSFELFEKTPMQIHKRHPVCVCILCRCCRICYQKKRSSTSNELTTISLLKESTSQERPVQCVERTYFLCITYEDNIIELRYFSTKTKTHIFHFDKIDTSPILFNFDNVWKCKWFKTEKLLYTLYISYF